MAGLRLGRGLLGLWLAMAMAGPAAAETLGSTDWQWNAGLGAASLSYPAWRGARESESLVLPLPVFSLWTENAEIGRGGLQVQTDLGDGWAVRLSISGSLPVDSDASPLREGLEDLDPTLEAGPAIGWTSNRSGAWQWRVETLLRGVVTLDVSAPQWLGWTLQPRLVAFWQRGQADLARASQIRLTLGPIWAERAQHRYFYQVSAAEAQANPLLREYQASGGYSGARASLSGTWIRGRARLSAYLSYDNLRGTAFADSPLRPEDDYWLIGTFISWRIWGDPRPLRIDD